MWDWLWSLKYWLQIIQWWRKGYNCASMMFRFLASSFHFFVDPKSLTFPPTLPPSPFSFRPTKCSCYLKLLVSSFYFLRIYPDFVTLFVFWKNSFKNQNLITGRYTSHFPANFASLTFQLSANKDCFSRYHKMMYAGTTQWDGIISEGAFLLICDFSIIHP